MTMIITINEYYAITLLPIISTSQNVPYALLYAMLSQLLLSFSHNISFLSLSVCFILSLSLSLSIYLSLPLSLSLSLSTLTFQDGRWHGSPIACAERRPGFVDGIFAAGVGVRRSHQISVQIRIRRSFVQSSSQLRQIDLCHVLCT